MEPGTTEIYISHRGMYEVFVSRQGPDEVATASRRIPSWKLKCCVALDGPLRCRGQARQRICRDEQDVRSNGRRSSRRRMAVASWRSRSGFDRARRRRTGA